MERAFLGMSHSPLMGLNPLPKAAEDELQVAIAATRSAEESFEYNLKAAFLFNFTKFVDWPPAGDTAAAEEKSPFQLCILGEDPFGKSLDAVVANETVGGRPIVLA